MFVQRKTSSVPLLLQFGLDHQGFVVPLLRRGKGQGLHLNLDLKIAALRPKALARLR
jgi:hypothetical protein